MKQVFVLCDRLYKVLLLHFNIMKQWRIGILILGGFFALSPVLTAQTVGEAVNLPVGVPFSTGGSKPWVVDVSGSLDEVSARSGAITHNQSSWLSVTVTGPASVGFWSRVSTEPLFDYLRVYDNGVELEALSRSGEIPWTRSTFHVGSGSHVIRWEFRKDEADDEAGANAVWLDQITIEPVDQGEPVIMTQPRRSGVEAGAPATLVVSAAGLAPLQYQWRHGGAPLTGQTNAQLLLPVFGTAEVGMYDCVVSNGLGSVTTSEVSLDMVSHGAALDDVTRFWYGHGQVFWQPQTEEGVAGDSALSSGAVADSEKSQFSASFTGPGTLRYWRKLSTEEGFDFLRVRLNGNVVHEVSGLRDWEAASFVLPAGTSTVSWSYEKNERFTFGDDAVWIDEVRLLQGQQSWLTAWFTTAQLADPTVSGWSADADHNGLANGLEYLLGRNPLSHLATPSGWLQAQIGPLEGPGSGPDRFGLLLELPLTLPDDVMLVVEFSEALEDWLPLAQKTGNASWTAVNGGMVMESPAIDGRIKTRVCHPDTAQVMPSSRFLRLRLELLAP